MNKIFVISGPSGVGKGTIIKGLIVNPKLNLYRAKTYTTRAERASDKIDHHYFFVSEKKFHELEGDGEILESNFYNGNWYGSSKSEIEKAFRNGKNVIKEIEVNGGMSYKKLFPNATLIFLKSSLNQIENRLIERGQNTPEQIKDRLKIAKKELTYEAEYQYSILNPEGRPEVAIREVEKIIQKELKN